MEDRIQRRGSIRPFLYGAAAGLVAGAVVALLFTPRSGKEMRRSVGQIVHRARERVAGHSADIHSGSFEE